MTLQQLAYFVEVYRYGSITKAAENLYVSHQTISAALLKLESEFNTVLFHRSANRIIPTIAGGDFYVYALSLLNAEAALRQAMLKHSSPLEEKQVIKIGMNDAMMTLYGDEIAVKLHSVFPDTQFQFLSLNYASDFSFYQQYDISFINYSSNEVPQFQLDEQFERRNLVNRQNYVWISKNSSLSSQPYLTQDMLKNHCNLILKEIFNTDTASQLYMQEKTMSVKLKTTFIDYLENYDYYASDAPIDHGHFVYSDILKGKKVVLKEVDHSFFTDVIYKKTAHNYLSVINSILL